jgi:hypothetical protein
MGPMYDDAACRWTGGGRVIWFSLKEASLSLTSLLFLVVFDRIDECHLFFTALSVLSDAQPGCSRFVVRSPNREVRLIDRLRRLTVPAASLLFWPTGFLTLPAFAK